MSVLHHKAGFSQTYQLLFMFQCNEHVEMNTCLCILARTWMKILDSKEALAIRRIFSLVGMITKAKFSNSPNDFKIRLFG